MKAALRFMPQPPDTSLLYVDNFSPAWVTVSIMLAILGAYAALRASARVRQLDSMARKLAWVAISAMTMGLSVWAMHFIGMLAFSLPCRVYYDPFITLLSMIPGILADGAAADIGWQNMRQLSSLSSSLILGAGIDMLHYTGMAAMRFEGLVRQNTSCSPSLSWSRWCWPMSRCASEAARSG